MNDQMTAVRDAVLDAWLPRAGGVFGQFWVAPPTGIRDVLIWRRRQILESFGAKFGFRRDVEAIYVAGGSTQAGRYPFGCHHDDQSTIIEYQERATPSCETWRRVATF